MFITSSCDLNTAPLDNFVSLYTAMGSTGLSDETG